MYKPFGKGRLFVAAIRNRRRIAGSLLFRGFSHRGDYSRAEDVWVIAASEHCRGWYDGETFRAWSPGQRALISDAFELEPTPPYAWDEIDHPPGEYSDLERMAAQVEGDIIVSIVNELSLLALVPADAPLQETETARDGTR